MTAYWTEWPTSPGEGSLPHCLPPAGADQALGTEMLSENTQHSMLQTAESVCSPADCLKLWYRFLAGIQVSPGTQASCIPFRQGPHRTGSLFFNSMSLDPLKILK